MFHFLTGIFFEGLHITLLNVHVFKATASARLAQSAERKALNLVVVGSSPTVGVFQVLPLRISGPGWPRDKREILTLVRCGFSLQ